MTIEILEIEDPVRVAGQSRRYAHWRCSCGTVGRGRLDAVRRLRFCEACARSRHVTHGATETALYRLWTNIKTRTNNPRNPGWPRYGGRGIELCSAWQDFAVFQNWALVNGYVPGLTLDRIDNDGNYEPSNCQWLTRSEHSRKTRREDPRGQHRS